MGVGRKIAEMRKLIRAGWMAGLLAILCGQLPAWAFTAAAPGGHDVVLASMDKELQRAKSELGRLTPAAYFISYTVYDEQEAMAVGINGSLITSTSNRKRMADVIMRVGTPAWTMPTARIGPQRSIAIPCRWMTIPGQLRTRSGG